MSKLADIKHRIDELDGGAFQNLCDELLCCKGYGVGYSLGMMTGTDKTAKGSPDTYFRTSDGKYILVMYTTQKLNVFDKIKTDIEKCFDPDLTGLSPADVAEVIYCHTCGRITAGEDKYLRELCGKYKAKLSLFGLDELGHELCYQYPHLAKDHLGIKVDSGQITTPEAFVSNHDASKTSAPLDTFFMFRDAEMTEAKEKLSKSDALLVSGPAGTGKTRFCLELIRQLSREHGLVPLCIRGNGLPLHEDLVTVLEPEKEYLILIDDANELSELKIVLGYLSSDSRKPRRIQKIILSVRDYARQSVMETVLETTRPEVLKIGRLTDNEIDKLMEALFEIRNTLYLEKINIIANGNARLAVLAGKVASEEQTLFSISDATDLYEHYYKSQIDKITSSELGVRAAGIIAFFQHMRLDNLRVFDSVFFLADISQDEFISEIHKLHSIELVDIAHDRAVRVSDQSFGNYLLKYVFVNRRIIPLSSMVVRSSEISMSRTVTACNILLSLFPDKHTSADVECELNKAWDLLSEDSMHFYPFFKAFFMLRPTETLRILQAKIKAEKARTFDVRQVNQDEFSGGENLDDDILQILCGFRHHQQLSTAIDLLMEYYQKRPDLCKQFYYAFIYAFGFDSQSKRYGFQAQRIVSEKLVEIINADPSENNTTLFIKVAGNYLKLIHTGAEEVSGKSFKAFTIIITSNQYILACRATLLQTMADLYQSEKNCSEIEAILAQYCQRGLSGENVDIIRQEWGYIKRFFEMFSYDNLNHCLIAEHISEIVKIAKVDAQAILEPFLSSRKYLICRALKIDYREQDKNDYQAPERRLLAKVKDLIVDYDVNDYQALFQVCGEYLRTADSQGWDLHRGIEDVFELISTDAKMSISVLLAYMEANTPYDICPYSTFQTIFKHFGADVLRTLITSRSYNQQNVWLWYFYAKMPNEFISPFWAGELLRYLDSVPQNVTSSPRRRIAALKKYESADNAIILKAAKTILANYDKSPFLAELYFEPLLNALGKGESNLMAKFSEDLPLLEEIYLKSVSYSKHSDYGGRLLEKIAEVDDDFILRYLDAWLEKEGLPYIGLEDSRANRMAFIWGLRSSYIDKIMEYLLASPTRKKKGLVKVLALLLRPAKGKVRIQDEWIASSIQQYSHDRDVCNAIFSAAEEFSPERRRKIVQTFLLCNSDYEDFKFLSLTSSLWGGSGSVIPSLQEKVDYLNSLLPLTDGAKFLQHRERIEQEIAMWEKQIKSEEINELLEDFC